MEKRTNVEIREIFNRIFDSIKYRSTCLKVTVGARYIGNTVDFTTVNCSNDGHSCKDSNECYKYKITGIYESCEETRKFCKSIHAEINLLNELKEEGISDLSEGEVFVTRYPCVNCAEELVKHNVRKISYCGKQEISQEVKDYLKNHKVEVYWYPEFDFEEDNNG